VRAAIITVERRELEPDPTGAQLYELDLDSREVRPASELITRLEFRDKPTRQHSLDWLQSMVGGSIEPIMLEPSRAEAYVNETGKIDGLPPNPVATRLWEHHLAGSGYDPLMDYIAGPLVIVGPLTEDGDTTGLTPEYERFLIGWMAEQQVTVNV
jgi:Domain of unknown function (DUF3846)